MELFRRWFMSSQLEQLAPDPELAPLEDRTSSKKIKSFFQEDHSLGSPFFGASGQIAENK